MHLSSRLRWQRVLSACLIVCGLSSCGGVDPIVVKERQIDELEYQSARQRESLVELLGETQQLQLQVTELEGEKSALSNKVEELEINLRFANEQIQTAVGQQLEAKERIEKLQRANDSLSRSLNKVKSVASASAGELADLRLKRQEKRTSRSRRVR